jgi:hypothetical protein
VEVAVQVAAVGALLLPSPLLPPLLLVVVLVVLGPDPSAAGLAALSA